VEQQRRLEGCSEVVSAAVTPPAARLDLPDAAGLLAASPGGAGSEHWWQQQRRQQQQLVRPFLPDIPPSGHIEKFSGSSRSSFGGCSTDWSAPS